MAVLTKDREASGAAPQGGPDGSPPEPEGACPNCGTALDRAQDWCLECGTVAPGRIGSHPAGWRAAATLIAVTMLLVGGAVVASYAALTGDAERDAARPPVAAAPAPGPDQPPAPITPAQPTGPGTDPQAVPPAKPEATPKPERPGAANPAPATPTPAPTPAPGPAAPTTPPAPQAVDIDLGRGSVATYDPSNRAGAEFGAASKATDGRSGTVWDVVVPADNEPIAAGLVINLGGAFDLKTIKVSSPTPGYSVEVYGSSDKDLPDDILDRRWKNLGANKATLSEQVFEVSGKTKKKVNRIVLWFLAGKEAVDPRVAISEVSIRGIP